MSTLKTWSRALVLGLFLAAVGIWLPFGHLYLLNTTNFTLPLSVHLPGLALLGLMVVLLAALLQLAVPGPARTGVRAGLMALGIFLWAETTLFIGNFGFFQGARPDWDANRHLLWLEILLAAALVALLIRARRFLLRRAGPIMILLTVSAAANLYAPWRTEQARTKLDTQFTFTKKGVFDLSADRNVLIFILDTYQADVFADIVATDRSWRQVFDGFTYFPDAVSAFPKTFGSVPDLLTGRAFDNSRPFPAYKRDAFLDGSVPRLLKRNGFDVRYHAVVWQPYLADPAVADNLAGFDSQEEIRWMRDREVALMDNLLLFRLAPFPLKPWVYNDGRFRLRDRPAPKPDHEDPGTLAEDQRRYSAGNDAEDLEFLDEVLAFMDSGSQRPACRIYHLAGAHAPFQLDADMNYTGPRDYAPGPFHDQSVGVLRLMLMVFDRLRAVGAYDNSLIIIVGDHGNGQLATLDIRTDALARLDGGPVAAFCEDPRLREVMRGGLPLVMAKPPEAHGPLRVSPAPVELGDVTATVVQVMDLKGAGTVPGRSLFDPDFDPHRKRLHRYYDFSGWNRDYIVPMTEYVIEGFSWDPRSWSPSARDLNLAAAASARGDMALLGRDGNLDEFPHSGWSEPDADGRFIRGDSASIVFQVPENASSAAILFTLNQLSPDTEAPIRVYTDGELAGIVDVGGMVRSRYRILLPDDGLTSGSPVAVRFLPEPGSNRGTEFVTIRMDYGARRRVWPLGKEISFTKGGRGEEYLNSGWGNPEDWGTWSRGPRSALSFSLGRRPSRDLLVRAELSGAIFGEAPPVRARLLANGEEIAEFEAGKPEPTERDFRISRGLVPDSGHLDLVLLVENPRSPMQYGVSPDPRLLGIALWSLSIGEVQDGE